MAGDRLVNVHSFECPKLTGLSVELFAGYYEDPEEDGIDIIFLKLKENRFSVKILCFGKY